MEAMVDPDTYLLLKLPDLSEPEILGRDSDARGTRLQLRYTFVGQLDPIVSRLIGNERLRWIQAIEIDPSARTGRLTFASEDSSRRLHGQALVVFAAQDAGTERETDGDLVVAVPIIGPSAERSIVKGLLQRLDLEAQSICERLGSS